jgi:hypothetical protein
MQTRLPRVPDSTRARTYLLVKHLQEFQLRLDILMLVLKILRALRWHTVTCIVLQLTTASANTTHSINPGVSHLLNLRQLCRHLVHAIDFTLNCLCQCLDLAVGVA